MLSIPSARHLPNFKHLRAVKPARIIKPTTARQAFLVLALRPRPFLISGEDSRVSRDRSLAFTITVLNLLFNLFSRKDSLALAPTNFSYFTWQSSIMSDTYYSETSSDGSDSSGAHRSPRPASRRHLSTLRVIPTSQITVPMISSVKLSRVSTTNHDCTDTYIPPST